MKIKGFLFSLFFISFQILSAQTQNNAISRPKLVVGLMVDQMRWDYLYRYYDRYSENGFKRLLREGFACENTLIPYSQTVTAAGHACVYTGSVPAINGIMGNEWYDRSLGRTVYCVEDKSEKTVGGSAMSQPMSPRNLWTTTITDELRLATNFKSKVIGIAIKDRGGILPAGHSANGVYWYDAITGNWVSSSYYMEELPSWVKQFNGRKVVDSFYKMDWNTLYPVSTYTQSDADDRPYEGKSSFDPKPAFPHLLSAQSGKNYSAILGTPHGSTLTLEFAKSALMAEELGKDAVTDFLALSLSSPDYTGHQYGPSSVEVEDTYLRLDQDLAQFFSFLDAKVGKGQSLLFITADHGVANTPGFLREHKIPAGTIPYGKTAAENAAIAKFGLANLVEGSTNYQLYLNYKSIDSAKLDGELIRKFIIDELNRDTTVLLAFDNKNISAANLPAGVKEMFIKGYNTKRGGDIQIILKPQYFMGFATGTTHGSWNPYDAHIPLIWMGWGIKPGKLYRETYMTDIAATLAAMLKIQMPSGNVGKVIEEVVK